MHTSGDGFAGQSSVEGTVIGTKNVGRAERLIKSAAFHGAAAPLLEGRVGPGDTQIGMNEGDAIAQNIEDIIGLKKRPGTLPNRGILRIDVNTVKLLGAKQGQPFAHAAGPHDVTIGLAAFQKRPGVHRGTVKNQYARSLRQRYLRMVVANGVVSTHRIIGINWSFRKEAKPRTAQRP